MQRPRNLAPYGVALPVIRPSDSLSLRETFPWLNLSAPVSHSPSMPTPLGPRGFGPIITSGTNGKPIYAEYSHAGTAINRHKDEVSQQAIGLDFTDALPEAIPYGQASPTRVVPITPDLNPSTLPGVPCTSPMAQYKVQGVSRNFPPQFPQTSMGPAAASLSRGDLGQSPEAPETTKPASPRDA
ncbi:hypothetical protein BJV78DRAFT_1279448 [Lactifluus subvellereus]|nr:hypothetical protein BJV78DRAFT_1279448 [Lactifluus subvellereus]